ncbi:MAG: hypothetical protein IK115_13985 [Lachnospiraceae bacterium]|nr:hypothetical protein [Lachnospiraceae bacterium]
MLPKHDGRIIRKKRYVIPAQNGLEAELDVFEEPFAPLMVAEVEFDSCEDAEAYQGEDWFGKEVTHDIRFKNARMAADLNVDPGVLLKAGED